MLGHSVRVRLRQLFAYSDVLLQNISVSSQVLRPGLRSVPVGWVYTTLYGTTTRHCGVPYLGPYTDRVLRHTHLSFGKLSCYPLARLSTSTVDMKIRPKDLSKTDGSGNSIDLKKTRQYNSPMIILIDTEEKVSSVSLSQAERMAKRRDLKLVKVEDPSLKSQDKQVYKLMTGKQYFEEEVKAKKSSKSSPSSKGEKILTMSGKIAAHDLKPKLQSIHKWLDKGHQIRVTVTSRGATKGDLESVYGTIEQEVKSNKGRVLQLREKFGDFKFTIVPSKVEKTSNQTPGESSERTHDSDHNVTHEASEPMKS